MAMYVYKARDSAGKLVKGSMDAAGKEEVIEKLRKMGYMATQVTQALGGSSIEPVLGRLRRVNPQDIMVFNVQLSNMINAGISILASLDAIEKQLENRRLKKVVGSIARSVEAGDSFSTALARHPSVFSKIFIDMIKAGEASGKLDIVLTRYSELFERQEELRRKIKEALFYPMILSFAGIAVTLFIVTFIIPQFAEIYTKAGIKLPLPTIILSKVGMGIKHFWHSLILAAIVGWIGARYYVNTEIGRINFDRIKLKLPIVGSICRKSAITRFARTLATLVSSGVPILESLDIVEEVIGNKVLGRVLANARACVEKGEKISESLKVSGEFPSDTIYMISAGEETGNLDGMLNKIADFYDMSLGYTVKKLTAMMEPLFTAIMGCLVGFIMLSMLLPIFDMMKILRHH